MSRMRSSRCTAPRATAGTRKYRVMTKVLRSCSKPLSTSRWLSPRFSAELSALDFGAADAVSGVARRLTAVVLLFVDDDAAVEERVFVAGIEIGVFDLDLEMGFALLVDFDV